MTIADIERRLWKELAPLQDGNLIANVILEMPKEDYSKVRYSEQMATPSPKATSRQA